MAIVAEADIAAGEEVTYNYRWTQLDTGVVGMQACRCGGPWDGGGVAPGRRQVGGVAGCRAAPTGPVDGLNCEAGGGAPQLDR